MTLNHLPRSKVNVILELFEKSLSRPYVLFTLDPSMFLSFINSYQVLVHINIISLKSSFDLNVSFFFTKSCSDYINSTNQTQPNSRANPQLNLGSGQGLLFENLRLGLLNGFTQQLFLVYSGSAFEVCFMH